MRGNALPIASVRGDEPVLRPSNRAGALYFLGAASASALALWLSAQPHPLLWLAGQALLALALLQWFVLLHEAGHMSLFRSRELNFMAGHVAGCMALIPFAAWRRVHGLHHLWTGWQDRDPTTAALTPRPRSRLQLAAVDIAWRVGLPLFALVYRLDNYWHMARLNALFSSPRQRLAIHANIAALLIFYAGAVWLLGIELAVTLFGLATLLALMLQEPLILSQHTHLPQRSSAGRRVAPLAPAVQANHTRSLEFPRWFAQGVLLNFNAHELHHRFAAVPGYRRRRIAWPAPHAVHWWAWLKAVKRMRGSTFLFDTRDRTGFRL
jgi:acyl-lipid omega-6 desaturase (Delta-12 desaturase)